MAATQFGLVSLGDRPWLRVVEHTTESGIRTAEECVRGVPLGVGTGDERTLHRGDMLQTLRVGSAERLITRNHTSCRKAGEGTWGVRVFQHVPSRREEGRRHLGDLPRAFVLERGDLRVEAYG
jgi:hypothetical protein